MGEMIKSSRLGSGESARVGTGSVPWVGPGAAGGWVEAIGRRVANEPLVVSTPPGNKVGLDVDKDTAVGGGWAEATGGRITKELLKVATPPGNEVGPELGASTGVEVAGGIAGISTNSWVSQANTEAKKKNAKPRADQVPTRFLIESILDHRLKVGPAVPKCFLNVKRAVPVIPQLKWLPVQLANVRCQSWTVFGWPVPVEPKTVPHLRVRIEGIHEHSSLSRCLFFDCRQDFGEPVCGCKIRTF